MNNFNLTDWALRHRAIVLFMLLIVAVAGSLQLHQARPARGPELLGAVDDRRRRLAGCDRPADAGRGAQPHGEEVRAGRPLREGGHLRAAGLWRHDPHREGRHLEGRPARSLVPGAQEAARPEPRTAGRRDRPGRQRRIRRRVRPDLRRQGRRHRPRRSVGRGREHQAQPAEGADGQEGRRDRQAVRAHLRRVLARAPGRARHHAAGHR